MKKLLHSLLLSGLPFMAAAQPFTLHLQELKEVKFSQPVFIGKSGDHNVLIDRSPDSPHTNLHMLSPEMQLAKTIQLPHAAYNSFCFNRENGININWLEKKNDTVRLQRLVLQKNGELNSTHHATLPKLPGPAALLVNRTGDAWFYYTLVIDEKNHINIGGVFVNDSLQVVARVDGSIDFDATQQRFAGPILDANGNVQLVIYDKLSNYRQSVNIRINTISSSSKEIVEESFVFEKIKLYDLLLSDNAITNQLNLTGFFYNAASKTIAGVASIRLPYERVNKLTHTFSAFTDDQRDYLATGMEYVRKHDDVFKFIKLRRIYNDNGHVLLGAWLLDMPQKKIVKDSDHEQHQNTETASWVNPVQLRETSRLQGTPMPVSITSYWVGSSIWDNNSINRLNSSPPAGLNKLDVIQRPIGSGVPRISYPTGPEKFVFFYVGPEGNLDWMQAVPREMPLQEISVNNTMPNHFFFDKAQWHIPFYDIKHEANKKTPGVASLNLASIGRTGVQRGSLLNTAPGQYYFSGLWKISDTQYLSAYRDLSSGESGVATLESVPPVTAKQ